LHDLSAKDWVRHIIFAVIFATGYLLVMHFYKNKRKEKAKDN
jgi:uncharacterized membrane protein YagU involved in acid resistance